jgi:hypothetical protein
MGGGGYFRAWVFVFVVLCVSGAAGKVRHHPDQEIAGTGNSKAAWRSAHPLAAWDLDGNVGPALGPCGMYYWDSSYSTGSTLFVKCAQECDWSQKQRNRGQGGKGRQR